MSFDAESFLTEYNIEYFTQGKNVADGYINICCPLCNDHSNHGGFNPKTGHYGCWRCGSHWIIKVISKLTNKTFNQSKKIYAKYSTKEHIYVNKDDENVNIYVNEIKYPSGAQSLTKRAKNYLKNRNFDPEYLTREWGLMSTGNTGEYKFCILAPIYLHGRLISYQCRDITGKAKTSYRPCHVDQSVYNFEYSLYGIDKALNIGKKCVVVEGITDVWRLGPGSVCTFGIQFTLQQVQLLKKSFEEIYILYDAEEIAQAQADRLFNLLKGYNKKVEVFTLEAGDPGELSDDEARKIMEELLK